MRLNLFAKILAGAMTASMAALINAAPILDNNVRQVTVQAPVQGSNEASLQEILDGLFLSSTWGDVNSSQSTAGLFAAATGSATPRPSLEWEAAANHLKNRFGMWFGTDANDLLFVPLFFGSADDGGAGGGIWEGSPATAEVQLTEGRVTIGSSIIDCIYQVNCRSIEDSRISTTYFGFYFHTISPDLDWGHFELNPSIALYGNTLDSLSGYQPGEQPRVLAFQNGATTNWAFAYEDGGDYDYNDMVVKVESIQAVPLPGTLALLGIGLIGMGALRRWRAR